MPDEWGRAEWGTDWDLERWTRGGRDQEGNLIWYHHLPNAREQAEITMVTLNFDPEGEPVYRNYHVSPDRPLDPYDPKSFDPDKYTLADLATQAIATLEFS